VRTRLVFFDEKPKLYFATIWHTPIAHCKYYEPLWSIPEDASLLKKDQLWISSRDNEKSVKIDYCDVGTNFPFYSYCQFVIPNLCIYV